MAVPSFKDLFTQVLDALADGRPLHRRALTDAVVAGLDLTDEERGETLRGGGSRVESRVGWAIEHLAQSGAVSRPVRGYVQITDLGRSLLSESPVTLERLQQTEGLQAWVRRSREGRDSRRARGVETLEVITESTENLTPEEMIDEGVEKFRAAIAVALLERVRSAGWQFFEHAILRVLHALGYGQGEEDLKHLGQTGDGGVDGLINQDRLGLDQIYVQAKCYKEGNNLSEAAVRDFVGAVTGKKATRGVFITTSRFTPAARTFVEGIPQPRIILIDGEELTQLMIDAGVGVAIEKEIKIYRIDENFFESS